MNIAVYCASSTPKSENFINKTIELGKQIGKDGHTLVFGGSNTGLMGLVSLHAHENGAKVIGVVPDIALIKKRVADYLDESIYLNSMADRRSKMIELSDIFIALPGGPGTLDELSEVMDLIRIDELKAHLILYNIDGFYDDIKNQIDKYIKYGLIEKGQLDKVHFCTNIDEIKEILGERL